MIVPQRQVVTLVAAPLALLGLAGLGAALAPSWDPPRLPAELAYPTLPPMSPAAVPFDGDVRKEETRIVVAGQTLAATVLAPASHGRHPAVVFVHGSGAGERDAFTGQAEQLARAGIVSMVYDKRTVGYSVFRRDYRQLADDALVAVRLLRERPDVDPAMVGLWGISEAGWVVPLAASTGHEVAFAVLVAAPATTPLRQSTWALDTRLRRLGAPDGAREAAVRAFGVGGFDYVHHNAQPVLRRLAVPLLAVYGTNDQTVPPVESPRRIADTLAGSGNTRYTVRFFAGAGHDMRVDGELAAGYLATMASWIRGLPGTGAPEPHLQVAGATPTQEYLSTDVPTPGYGRPAALLVVYLLIAVSYLAAPVLGLIGRLRRRWSPPAARPRLRRRLRWLLGCGLATVLGLNAFLVAVVTPAAAPSGAGWVADVGWLAVRSIAVLTTALLVSTVVNAISAHRAGWRPRGVERVRLLGVCGGTAVALVLASYWGLFALQW